MSEEKLTPPATCDFACQTVRCKDDVVSLIDVAIQTDPHADFPDLSYDELSDGEEARGNSSGESAYGHLFKDKNADFPALPGQEPKSVAAGPSVEGRWGSLSKSSLTKSIVELSSKVTLAKSDIEFTSTVLVAKSDVGLSSKLSMTRSDMGSSSRFSLAKSDAESSSRLSLGESSSKASIARSIVESSSSDPIVVVHKRKSRKRRRRTKVAKQETEAAAAAESNMGEDVGVGIVEEDDVLINLKDDKEFPPLC